MKDNCRHSRADLHSWFKSKVWLVPLLCVPIAGCSSGGSAELLAGTQALGEPQNDLVMGFESPSFWTASAGALGSSSNASQGLFSLSTHPVNYTTFTSARLSSLGAFRGVAVDLLMPATQPNPFWLGAIQLFVSAPSRNIFNAYLGQNELTGQPVAQWNSEEFAVSSSVSDQLNAAPYNDLTFTVVLNVPGAPGEYLLDHLRTRVNTVPWPTPPANFTTITDEQLKALRATNDVFEVTPEDRDRQHDARTARAAEDAATIQQLLAVRSDLADRINATPDPSTTVLPDGNVQIALPDSGQNIQLNGRRVRDGSFAAAFRTFNNLTNQQTLYRAIFPLVPDACMNGLPDPSTIGALGVEDLKTLNRRIGHCWRAASVDFGRHKEVPDPDPDPSSETGSPVGVNDGIIGDESPICASNQHITGGIFRRASWRGKAFDTSVKSQGVRGSCVAFGTIGAMENSIAQSTGLRVNLSEQLLYARAKLLWEPDDFGDGLNPYDIVQNMVDTRYAIPFERIWPYNPSPDRVGCFEDGSCGESAKFADPDYYKFSCDFNGKDVYTGPSCANTTHQAREVWANGHAYHVIPKGDGAFGITSVVGLDDIEDVDSANLALVFLNAGFGVTISFDVLKSFGSELGPDGIWQGPRSNDRFLGGHLVEASGVVLNSQLPDGVPQGKGGGWIIIKNSWGKCFGDAGFAYMSFDAANQVLGMATAILPTAPLVRTRPTIRITTPHPGDHFHPTLLDPTISFIAHTSDEQDGDDNCAVKWTSDIQGVLSQKASFDGSLIAGVHHIKAVATNSLGKQSSDEVTITVEHDPPIAKILLPDGGGDVPLDTAVAVQGSAQSPELFTIPCTSLQWNSSVASDSINGQSGCSFFTRFHTTGTRTLTLKATDSFGATASAQVTINVVSAQSSNPPTVVIRQPGIGTAGNEFAVPAVGINGVIPIQLGAVVTDPGSFPQCPVNLPSCVDTTWSVREEGTGPFTVISSAPNFLWSPSDSFPTLVSQLRCGGTMAVEVRLCATDPNGTTCKSTFLALNGPGPC